MYTLADLTQITGAKRRSVQLWAEAGVLQAAPSTERSGSGVHRQFSRKEAIIACIVHTFALKGVPIGRLLTISKGVRHSLRAVKEAMPLIELAIENKSNVFLAVDASTHDFLWFEKPTGEDALKVFEMMHTANYAVDLILLNGSLKAMRFFQK